MMREIHPRHNDPMVLYAGLMMMVTKRAAYEDSDVHTRRGFDSHLTEVNVQPKNRHLRGGRT